MEVVKWTVRTCRENTTRVWLTLVSLSTANHAIRYATHTDEVEALLTALYMAAKAVTGWTIDRTSERLVSWQDGQYSVTIDLIKDKGDCLNVLFGNGRAQSRSLMQAIIDAFVAALNDLEGQFNERQVKGGIS